MKFDKIVIAAKKKRVTAQIKNNKSNKTYFN